MPGFTYSPNVFASDSSRQQLDGSEKLASCGAAISRICGPTEGRHMGKERLAAIGGRYLPIVPGITSADTEYDGLLLGLEWLVCAFSSDQEIYNMDLYKDDEQRLLGPKLIIRGDCKTVIDQLESRSIPRKMEEKYNLAVQRIESLKELYSEFQQRIVCKNLDDETVLQELTICFEHVPRENNHFCDAICKLVINQKQAQIVESIQNLIRLGEEDARKNIENQCNNCIDNNIERKQRKRSKKKGGSHPKSNYLQQAINSICYTPQLCHSSRLALACELTNVSIKLRDAAILNDLSNFFLQMSRRWARIYYGEQEDTQASTDRRRNTLRRASIACENLSEHIILGDILGGDEKELAHDKIDSIFEFCTMTNSRDSEKIVASENSAILMPYLDILDIISQVDVKPWRDELLNWNTIASECSKEETCTQSSNCSDDIWIAPTAHECEMFLDAVTYLPDFDRPNATSL